MVWCLRVTHSGRQVWVCRCPRRPSVPREDTVAQPRVVTLREGDHRNALAFPGVYSDADGRFGIRKKFAFGSGGVKSLMCILSCCQVPPAT